MIRSRPSLVRHLTPFLLAAASGAAHGATIQVNATADDFDLGPNGNCTLREAVIAANSDAAVDACTAGQGAPVIDVIQIPAGTYVLSVGPAGDADALRGDLDLAAGVELIGAGARSTIIDADQLDRVIDVVTSAGVSIEGVTLRGGQAGAEGGGIRNGGVLFVDRVAIVDNHADGPGGGIRNNNSVEVRRSALLRNTTNDHGGGIDNHGNALFENVTVAGNAVSGGVGGGIYVNGGEQLDLLYSTVFDNTATGGGDAVNNLGFLPVSGSILIGGCNGALTSNGANLESPGDTCDLDQASDQVGVADPGVTGPADHGGETDTVALLAGSPAIDLGDLVACPADDQRGSPRPVDGDGSGTAECDAGAFEAGSAPPVFADGFETGDTSAWSETVG